MDYRRQLAKENSKNNWLLIMADIGDDVLKFKAIVDIFLSDDKVMVQRVAQIIGLTAEAKPNLLQPHLAQLVDRLFDDTIDAYKRNTLRTFQYVSITEEIEGKLFDITLTFLKSNDEAIAVRAFSMTVLGRICENHPELSQEICQTIELILEENKSGAIQSRGKRVLKKLKKIILQKNRFYLFTSIIIQSHKSSISSSAFYRQFITPN